MMSIPESTSMVLFNKKTPEAGDIKSLYIKECLNNVDKSGLGVFIIAEKKTMWKCGFFVFKTIPGSLDKIELSLRLKESSRNKSVMIDTCQDIIVFGFDKNRFINSIICGTANEHVLRIASEMCGMKQIGSTREHLVKMWYIMANRKESLEVINILRLTSKNHQLSNIRL